MIKTIKKILIGIAAVLVCLAVIGSCTHDEKSSSGTSKSVEKEQSVKKPQYLTVSIATMMNDLERNAMVATDKYKGKNVKIVDGIVSTIESDGDYISVENPGADFSLSDVTCRPKNNNVKKQFRNIQIGERITVYGKITDVGEVLGYTLDLEKIE